MSSMFRSPLDVSSSDSDSVFEDGYTGDGDVPRSPDAKMAIPSSPPISAGEETIPHEASQQDTGAEQEIIPDLDTEGHAAMMTTALLEFYCISRATDILNQEPGSHGRYTRESPEVQFLGRRLYSYNSRFLSSHGVVADGIDGEDWDKLRQHYRESLDTISLIAVDGADVNAKSSRPSSRRGLEGSEVSFDFADFKKQVPHERQAIGDLATRQQGRIGLQRRITDGASILTRTTNPLTSLVPLAQPAKARTPFSLPALYPQAQQAQHGISRYATEFEEQALIGKGSYGAVFRAKHHVDGQVYAVKKIPLGSKRLKQLQDGGLEELNHILKEIRTLARLEHTNIVRYYGAWAEFSTFAGVPTTMTKVPTAPSAGEPQALISSQYPGVNDLSFGDVFEDRSNDGNIIVFEESARSEEVGSETQLSGKMSTERRDSGTVASSLKSRKSSFRSPSINPSGEDEDDGDIESIPRDFNSDGRTSTFGSTEGEIFSDGLTGSKSQIQIGHKNMDMSGPILTLHIQMSIHPISLARYLNPDGPGNRSTCPRHCYHLVPSVKMLLGILSGVEYLHATGVVHRDLKPANIFLSHDPVGDLACPSCAVDGDVKHCYVPRIGDFGLVAEMSKFGDKENQPESSCAAPRRPVGTEFYRPPSVVSGFATAPYSVSGHDFQTGNIPASPNCDNLGVQSISPQSPFNVDESLDVYSLGVILFELLYKFGTRMERQMALSNLTCSSVNRKSSRRASVSLQPDLPEDFSTKVGATCGPSHEGNLLISTHLARCITGMLNPDSRRRWSCKDVRACLEQVLASAQMEPKSG